MATWTSTSSSSNIQNNSTIFSCFSLPPVFSQICRKTTFTPFAGPRKKRRQSPPENMSVTLPVSPPSPRTYSDDQPFLDYTTRKSLLFTHTYISFLIIRLIYLRNAVSENRTGMTIDKKSRIFVCLYFLYCCYH